MFSILDISNYLFKVTFLISSLEKFISRMAKSMIKTVIHRVSECNWTV